MRYIMQWSHVYIERQCSTSCCGLNIELCMTLQLRRVGDYIGHDGAAEGVTT